ncbi:MULTISPECIES: pseudouridine synthase [unclassified Oceanispirochaeta]|uniref:pseudouridine synthase n=1 Tax=unclassified Oceanispirochaeta TaxID=2635722 RepID=UPI000E0997A5|nr:MULTISPECIES: pseudouridine synthase [unclassified Oceanispirochaeta]MBF9018581.1 RNA pseudouridine synthase [Oceanispirochaeta sp. M2]NPD75012.1 RNA pseudouridine synthase [Oceanispirochaeta sp. M1]RDG29133.1 RNA pseudouridine synthase [Oceanispirochaeta sp. M1]
MISIIREEKDFYVCEKEAGQDFHNSDDGLGFFSLLKKQMKEIYPEETLYPVHRLDKVTSGLILAARNKEAASGLGELISSGGIEKIYLALSDKKPRKKQGWITGDMERSRRGQWILTRGRSNPARSYFFSRSVRPGLRLFFVRIYTGKTHQIRVALKSLGSPILGDPLYYASGPEADRCYLHSWRMKFQWKNQYFDLESRPLSGPLFEELNLLGPDLLRGSCPVFP